MVGKKTPDTMMSASRLPALMGLSKFSTANDELDITIAAHKGEKRQNKQKEAMAWGDCVEPVILREAAKRLELVDLVLNHEQAYYYRDGLPLCCSLDGTSDGGGQVITTDPDQGIFVIGQDSITLDGIGVLEAKLTSVQAEDVPALYRGPIQLQAQMEIMQAKWGAVCVLYRGVQLRIFLFAPHAQTIKTIEHVVLDFQRRLDKFKATGEIEYYPPQNSADASRMYPVASEDTITLGAEAELLAERIDAAKKVIVEAESDKADAETKLKVLLGEAKAATAGRYEIKWPMRSYRAQPERITPAKEAYSIRQSTISVKELQ